MELTVTDESTHLHDMRAPNESTDITHIHEQHTRGHRLVY